MKWLRLNVVVEGQTEEEFAKSILGHHLREFSISVHPRMVSHPPKRSKKQERGLRKHKGGFLDFEWLQKDLEMWMKEDTASDARFTTMVDLYCYPQNAPGYDKAKHLTGHEKIQKLEQCMADFFQANRFIPYIQMHEFETLLFADLNKWGVVFLENPRALTKLARSLAPFDNIEMINDNDQTAPSKRILSHLPEYNKVLSGNVLAFEIGLAQMRKKCRHFDEWVSKLESINRIDVTDTTLS